MGINKVTVEGKVKRAELVSGGVYLMLAVDSWVKIKGSEGNTVWTKKHTIVNTFLYGFPGNFEKEILDRNYDVVIVRGYISFMDLTNRIVPVVIAENFGLYNVVDLTLGRRRFQPFYSPEDCDSDYDNDDWGYDPIMGMFD